MKNLILKGVMSVVFFIWCFSACCMDSEAYWIPMIMFIISSAILFLFAWVNGAMD